jgi:hypothetical protein
MMGMKGKGFKLARDFMEFLSETGTRHPNGMYPGPVRFRWIPGHEIAIPGTKFPHSIKIATGVSQPASNFKIADRHLPKITLIFSPETIVLNKSPLALRWFSCIA